ncbi:MAG: FAD-dependent oxidoreductase [Pseudomonadota bacterium]
MKIAIIGTGIAGLTAAYLLNNQHDITIYEKNNYIGGHSRTIDVAVDNTKIPVDTGFIVFNKLNYPHLTSLFDKLNIPITDASMSFGVAINDDNGLLEYGTESLTNLFAQKDNFLRPNFWLMLKDIIKFNIAAKRIIKHSYDLNNLTIGKFLADMKIGNWFQEYYLLPMAASIWSSPIKDIVKFPAQTLLSFFHNHGLLNVINQPQWHSIQGGSREYVKILTKDFADKVHLNMAVKNVERNSDKILLTAENGETYEYDQVVFACHSAQILPILSNPTDMEQEVISAIKYQPNELYVHTDVNFMPENKKAWASWVYLSKDISDENDPSGKAQDAIDNVSDDPYKTISLSYWMNNLQKLDTDVPIIVTLNPSVKPDEAKILDHHIFHHPVFDQKAINAQKKIPDIQGQDKIWFVGAWQRYGFHEDGILSAVNMAKKLGVEVPWI